MKKFFVLQFSLIALATAGVLGIPNPENVRVTTLNGDVQGLLKKTCRNQVTFGAFRSIPYAQPPVGELRFRDPVPVKNWEGVYDATYQRSGCLEGAFEQDESHLLKSFSNQSEDCLYLNVYTPNVNYLKTRRGPLKAVMVFIHMGAFMMGSSNEEKISPDFLVDQDVILVTFNYRLGALGFLSFQNSEVPGNAGLKDQLLVLKWVKNNIRNFGGDPNKITIFGESAGSASVNYHLLSKSSKGLFNNAIMQSGTAITTWAYSPPESALAKSKTLAHKLGCKQNDLKQVLRCLQTLKAENIRDLQVDALSLPDILTLRIIPFHPTIEPDIPGAFLTTPPFDLLSTGNYTKVPVVIGSTADEGLLLYPFFSKHDPYGLFLTVVGLDLSRFAPYHFKIRPFSRIGSEVHSQISKFYFNGKMVTKSKLRQVLELVSDTMFIVPIQLTAGLLSDHGVPVYNYQFSYDGSYGLGKADCNIRQVGGVCHGDENGYLFYVPDLHKNCGRNVTADINSVDELMINRMTKMWTNFAKYGNPTPKFDPEVPVIWKPFTPNQNSYLDINTLLVPSDSLKLGNMMFWADLIKKLIEYKTTHRNEQDLSDKIWNSLLDYSE